jgi:hypothetical protein
MESTIFLKPEWWGSLLIQEQYLEEFCDKGR